MGICVSCQLRGAKVPSDSDNTETPIEVEESKTETTVQEVQLFESGTYLSTTSDDDIRLQFEEICNQLEQYDSIGYAESPSEYRITYGEKSIEAILNDGLKT